MLRNALSNKSQYIATFKKRLVFKFISIFCLYDDIFLGFDDTFNFNTDNFRKILTKRRFQTESILWREDILMYGLT